MKGKDEILRRIGHTGLVPVVRAPSVEAAVGAARAVKAGGVDIIEITFTVPGAREAIERVSREMGDEVLVGAGTVLDAQTARVAIAAGAQFIVSPGLDVPTIEMAHRYGKPAVPGCLTPTEVLTALAKGADMVKIFPADCVGGPKYIKALLGPIPQVELVPTGGVNLENAGDFIKAGAAALGVGGSLVDKRAVTEGNWEVITENARKFLEKVKEARVGGVSGK